MRITIENCQICGFWTQGQLPKLKLPLRRRRSGSIEAIKENSVKELKAIPQSAYEKGWRIGSGAGIVVLHSMGLHLNTAA